MLLPTYKFKVRVCCGDETCIIAKAVYACVCECVMPAIECARWSHASDRLETKSCV